MNNISYFGDSGFAQFLMDRRIVKAGWKIVPKQAVPTEPSMACIPFLSETLSKSRRFQDCRIWQAQQAARLYCTSYSCYIRSGQILSDSSLSLYFWILPLAVMGYSSMKWIYLGIL